MIPEKRLDLQPASIPVAGGPPAEGAVPGAATPGLFAWYAPGFSDTLGDRLLLFDNTDGRPLELLRLRPEVAGSPGFECALRDRARELADFDDAHFARVCRVDRLPDPGGGLAVVSEHVEGQRLSEVLAVVRQRRARLGADLAMTLVADVAAGIEALHARGPQVAHGLLAPERLVLTPAGRLLITEYVLGLAVRSLACDRDSKGHDPWSSREPFDQRADVVQLGLVALSLLLARPLAAGDYPTRLADLLAEAEDRTRLGGWSLERWEAARRWLERMLSREAPGRFANGGEARRALDEDVLRKAEPRHVPGMECARLLLDAGPTSVATAPAAERSPQAESESAVGAEDLRALDGQSALDDRPGAPEPAPARQRGAWQRDKPGSRARQLAIVILSLMVLVEGVYIASRVTARGGSVITTGRVRVESNPAGASVAVDGKSSGATPLVLQLAPGGHTLDLALAGRRRSVAIRVEAGASLAQYVELPPEPVATGEIDVRSDPAGARVIVDGVPRGAAPLVVTGLPIGEHQVRVEGRGRSVTQTVRVDGTQAAALFVPFAAGNLPAAGWLTVAAPVEVQVYEDGELLGTSRSERIMLPAGAHELVLVSDTVGFRDTRAVEVPPGRTATTEVKLPKGSIDINAAPWAEVFIDGERVGETPLAAVPVTAGKHAVKFRHPTLGERTIECLVTLRQPARVSTDLRR